MEQTADTAYISVPGFVSILKEFLERKCEGKSTGREKENLLYGRCFEIMKTVSEKPDI